MSELLPCPHCGETLIQHSDHHGSWWAHRNEPADCAHGVTQLFDDEDIERWNRRAPSPSPAPGVVEAAKRFPDPGDKMIFLNRNGYDSERERAASVFTAGKEYTVRDVSIGSWTTSLQFDEVEGRWNSVMFGFASLSQLAKSEREGG